MKNRNGFTLIELMISIAVTAILLTAVYLAVNTCQRNTSAITRKVTAQQDIKAALEIMSIEIAMASYNSRQVGGIWENTACGPAPTADMKYKGIQGASSTAITIEMDLNDNGALDGTNEVIRYNYDTTSGNRRITRSTSCGGDEAFLGDSIASGRPRNVRVVNADMNPVVPIFRYFDGTGTVIAEGNLPLRGGDFDIQRIEITLVVETEHADPNSGQPKRLIYSTSVIPRNHVITTKAF